MNKIILIFGPTASSKSRIAIEVSKRFGCEIINADSRQFFKYMEIGTASPTEEEREMAVHHLYNILLPDEKINAGKFIRMADERILDVIDRNKIPLIVGGTGLYIKALIGGIAPIPDIPEEFRRLAKEIIREKGLSYCYELLIKSDPEYAIKISKTDSQRIERALEVLLFTKQGFSQFHKSHRFNQKRYEHISIRIIPDREILYKRIEKRTEDIFKNGIIEETKFLMENDYIDSHAFNAIGYYETYRYIKNEIELKDAIEMTARRTRQYAKRQMTWFRHSEGKIFNGIESIDEIFRYIEICLK